MKNAIIITLTIIFSSNVLATGGTGGTTPMLETKPVVKETTKPNPNYMPRR